MSLERFDVAIVGAGPAGSSAAISLARNGHSVVLLDQALFPREKLCGDFLNPINWPLFAQLGVADQLLSCEHEEVTAFRISTFSGEEATIRFPPRNGQPHYGLGLKRFYLDDLLLRAAEREGVVVRQGCRIRRLARENGGWTISLDDHFMGKRVQAVFLIGADGRNSLVAHHLGLTRRKEESGNHVAFQMHLQGVRGVGGDVQIHGFPGGYAGLVGLGGGTVNLCFSVEKSRAREELAIDALFENCLFKNGYLRESLRACEVVGRVRSAYPLYFSPRRSYGDGFLLVGDAARVTEPVTGEGIYFALKSGMLAGDAALLAFRERRRSAEQFAGYERLCLKAFSFRQRVNKGIRGLIYRPALLSPLIRLSAKTTFPLRPLVEWACRPG